MPSPFRGMRQTSPPWHIAMPSGGGIHSISAIMSRLRMFFVTRLLRISAANIGPNRLHQNRTVSWLMSPALGQQILDVAQRQRVSHVHHHNQTDDLRRAVEISERVAHDVKLPRRDDAGFFV